MSKVIQVRGVPDDVHAKLVEAAERAGKSLAAYLAEELALVAAERALQTFTDMAIERHPAAPLRQRIWELRHNLTPTAPPTWRSRKHSGPRPW